MPTSNPVPSQDPTDLLFNAAKLDEVVSSTAATYTDRLGVSRRSLSGIDAAADNVLNAIGYSVPVAYASGISLTLTSQTVDYNGVVYAPKSSALPFTTSSWGADSAKFRAVQVTDADLITYTPAGTGAVPTTVQAKLREIDNACQSGRFRAGYDGTAADYQKASLHINKSATNHAHYGVLDSTEYDFTTSPDTFIGNASFNDNTVTSGNKSTNHHHSYQSYPHVNMSSATIDVLSSFWSLQDIVSGTVSEATGVKINNPSGAGTITNLYGVKVEDLTRASNNNIGVYIAGASGGAGSNWAVFSAGRDVKSHFGGYVSLGRGSEANHAAIGYSPDLGHLMAQPRISYDFKLSPNGTSTYIPYLRFGPSTQDGLDAKIGYNSVNGNLELTPRSGFDTNVTSGSLLVGKSTTAFTNAGFTAISTGELNATRSDSYAIALNRLSSDGDIQRFYRQTVQVGSISVTGSATAYNTTSDYRLKDNQKPLTGSGEFIDSLKPKIWTWKADGTPGVGFIAHEVQEVSPTSVVGEKDAMRVEQYEVSPAVPAVLDEEGSVVTPAVEAVMGEREVPAYQAMEYGSAEFIANIIAELQSLRKRVSALEAK